MMQFKLSNKTIATIAAVALASKLGTVTANAAMFNDDEAIKNVGTLSKSTATQRFNNVNINKVIQDGSGAVSVVDALEAILQDSRGTCVGSLRCAVALSTNNLMYAEDKFKDTGLDHKKLGNYAMSVSGDSEKARTILISDGDSEYIKDTMQEYAKKRGEELKFNGNMSEYMVSQSLKVEEILGYTVVVMNPHAEESMGVIKSGLSILDEATK